MSDVVGRPMPASIRAPRQAGDAALAALALGAYVLSTIKFQNRDPLSTDGGIQAIIEICALGFGLAMGMERWMSWPAKVPESAVAMSFGFAAAVGVFFGFYPAQKAARLDPIDALRFE